MTSDNPDHDKAQGHTTESGSARAAGLGPIVAIGMPVYNGESYVEEAIRSVIAQTFPQWRLVVCDNVSTDSTRDIVASLAEQDERIKLIVNSENVGAPRNYNLSFTESEPAEFFLWLCADDVLAPEFLETMVALLSQDLAAVGAFSSAAIIDPDGVKTGEMASEVSSGRLAKTSALLRYRGSLYTLPALPLFGLFRRDVMATSALHGLGIGGDRVFLGEMALRGRLIHKAEPLFFRRVHPEQFSGGHISKEQKKAWFPSLQGQSRLKSSVLGQRVAAHVAAVRTSPVSMPTRVLAIAASVIEVPLLMLNMNVRRVLRDRLKAKR